MSTRAHRELRREEAFMLVCVPHERPHERRPDGGHRGSLGPPDTDVRRWPRPAARPPGTGDETRWQVAWTVCRRSPHASRPGGRRAGSCTSPRRRLGRSGARPMLAVLIDGRSAFKFARTIEKRRRAERAPHAPGAVREVPHVYPHSDAEAVRLADTLHRATEGLPGPRVLSDVPSPGQSGALPLRRFRGETQARQ